MKTHPDIFSRSLPPHQVYKIRHRFLLKSPNATARKASAEASVNIRDLNIKISKMNLQKKPKLYNNVRIKYPQPENPVVTNLSFSIHIPKPAIESSKQLTRPKVRSVPPLVYHRKRLSNTFDKLMGNLNSLGKDLEALSKDHLTQRSIGIDLFNHTHTKETIKEYDPVIAKKLKKLGVDVVFLNSLRKIGAKQRKIQRSKSEDRIQQPEILRRQLSEVKFRTFEKEFCLKDKDISIHRLDSSYSRNLQMTPVKISNYQNLSSTSKKSDFNISCRKSESGRVDMQNYKVFRMPNPRITIMNNPLQKLLNKKNLKLSVVKDYTLEDKLAELIRNNINF